MSSVFLKLNKNIQNFLAKKNISLPTEPQTIAIPPILAGKNILLIAPTGHGKTESALLPIFHNFLKIKENNFELKGISILYITPLRALNRDMLKRTFEWGKKLGIKIAVRHGDTSQSERVRQSKNPPDMLITTPETLQILFTGKRLRKHLESIRFVIVDEIHELAGDERGAQLSVGLERLNELNKLGNFQRVGLSATVGSPEEVSKFLGGYKDNKFRDVTILDVDITKHIEIAVEIPEIKKTDYSYSNKLSIEPISFASLRRCKELIDSNKSCLVFINTRDGAEILSSRFHQWVKDFAVDVHHGSLSKNSRIEAEDNFKAGHLKSLICTSSLELGIDVGLTDFVIQYNSPREVKRIVQRVGRSGHSIGKTSKGLIIATSPEDLVESTVIAKRALNGKIEKLNIRQNPLSVLSNQIISMALEYGKISTDEIYKIVTRAYPFYKLKKELFLKVLDQLKNQRSLWLEDNFVIKKLSSRHYFLENISMIPDETTFLAVDISSRKKIGKLDESFVLNYGFEGAKFILRGRPWMVVKTEDDKLLISESKEIGNAPSWTGEDIPIPFEVAKEVGILRKNRLFQGYPWDEKSFGKFMTYLENQKKQGFIIPDDKTITIDVSEKTVVINACFGTKVNETMARIISAMLVQQLGESIGINSDAYRITLELPARIHPEKIKNLFLQIKPESLFYLLDRILKNSTYVRWELVNVARKFGAIKKILIIEMSVQKNFSRFLKIH
jgi:ATP-dependent helicase Lhr and Lhr-like helicase